MKTKCKWCGKGTMKRHHDFVKAGMGLKICTRCNMVYSPNATISDSVAWWDGERIKTEIKKQTAAINV